MNKYYQLGLEDTFFYTATWNEVYLDDANNVNNSISQLLLLNKKRYSVIIHFY